jgi:hypothetical protein
MSYFANDDWQPADWLRALDRLAVTPPLEEIPVSSKMLDTMPNVPTWSWPTPRTFANQIPDDQQVILVWHDQSWQPAYMSHNLKQYYLLGEPYEGWHSLSVDDVWLPMPPAIEVQP